MSAAPKVWEGVGGLAHRVLGMCCPLCSLKQLPLTTSSQGSSKAQIRSVDLKNVAWEGFLAADCVSNCKQLASGTPRWRGEAGYLSSADWLLISAGVWGQPWEMSALVVSLRCSHVKPGQWWAKEEH